MDAADLDMDFTNTPTDTLLPDMFYTWEVTEQDTMEAGANKTLCSVCGMPKGKKMITVKYRVIEPIEYFSSEVMEFFTVGMDTDPCAHQGTTLMSPKNFGAVNFGLLLDATQTPRNQIKSLVGKRCQRATVQVEIEDKKNGGTRRVNNFVKGRNGSLGVYPVGTVPVGQPSPDNGRGTQPSPAGQQARPTVPMVACPRCKIQFSATEIDDHVAECAANGLSGHDKIPF